MLIQHKISLVKSSHTLDWAGIFLSWLCLLHCLALPFVMLSLPILARYYLTHPFAHIVFALLVVPVALVALWRGFKVHGYLFIPVMGFIGASGLVGIAILRIFSKFVQQHELTLVTMMTLVIMLAHGFNIFIRPICQVRSRVE